MSINMLFKDLGLKKTLLQAISDTGYTSPTPIQAQAIPAILSGKDVMAAAQTGTGKTAGFTLPLLHRLSNGRRARPNHTRALVLTPTRELAAQVQQSVATYGTHERLSSVVAFGGVKINPQMMAMRKGADILVATPGRLLDLHQQNAVKFDDLETLVLDEADRMLDMGFIRDIQRILKLLPKKRQNLMFSATFSNEIRALVKDLCNDPVQIDVAPRNSTVATVTQQVFEVPKEQKSRVLIALLKESPKQTIVFSRTKHGANKLVRVLDKAGLTAAAIHGNKSQGQRTKALADFKQEQIQVLVATDIAARGIDIDQLAQVINYDLPEVAENYVHRIGRTGRAGVSGLAMSLVAPDEAKLLKDIERLIKLKIDRVALPTIEASADNTTDTATSLQKPTSEKHNRKKTDSQNKQQQNNEAKSRSKNPASSTKPNAKNKSGDPKTELASSPKADPAKRRRRRRSRKPSESKGTNLSASL